MKKEIFKLRHATLVAALTLAVAAPLSFADEVPVDGATAVVALPGSDIAPGVDVEPAANGSDLIATTPSPVGDDVTIDPPALPVEGGDVVVGDPIPVEGGDVIPEQAAPVEGGDVVVGDPIPVEGGDVIPEQAAPVESTDVVVVNEVPMADVPVDDCGVICQNVAGDPEPAVYKSDEPAPEVMQFGSNSAAPDPALNVSAEISGAIGVAEQLGAADVAVQDGMAVDPLVLAAPATVVAKTTDGDGVSVIRDGHLR